MIGTIAIIILLFIIGIDVSSALKAILRVEALLTKFGARLNGIEDSDESA